MTVQAPPVLAADHVRFGYTPEAPVLHELTASLSAGRLCALIGPNAAGKSTLLKLMLGRLAPDRGALTLCGHRVHRLTPARRAAWMSYVPQRADARFAFSVEQVVAMARYALPPDSDAVESALAQCDLAPLRRRAFTELSGGQQQRVLLARALAQAGGQGRAVLLDEPTSAMDLWHEHRTMRALAAMARRGMAVLAVLHDINLAARYVDEVWLLDAGRVVASGPWDRVLRPEVLEPVYRVRFVPLGHPGTDRPVFMVQPSDSGRSAAMMT